MRTYTRYTVQTESVLLNARCTGVTNYNVLMFLGACSSQMGARWSPWVLGDSYGLFMG